MPGIYQIACNRCDYSVRSSESLTYVVLEDGSEEICHHPGERPTAERITGKSWQELRESNRLIYRYALICLGCGEFNYYGPRDLSPDVRVGGHITSITHRPPASEAVQYACAACGSHSLCSLGGEPKGCLVFLGEQLGLVRKREKAKVPCPKCKQGALGIEMVAIS